MPAQRGTDGGQAVGAARQSLTVVFGEPGDVVERVVQGGDRAFDGGALVVQFGADGHQIHEVLRRHYFIPPIEPEELTGDTVDQRAGQLLDRWLADVARRPNMWMAFTATAGPGADPEVAAVLREAATLVARRLLDALGLDEDGPDGRRLARVIAWGCLARGAIDQWLVERTLTVGDVRTALVATLMTLLELPDASDER